MKKLLIETEVLQEVLNYLSTKSFAEVANLIAKVQKSVQDNNKEETQENVQQ